MATIKPRINVTLSNEVYEAIKEFSDIAGCSMSSVVADMLTTNLETFRTTTMIISMAKSMEKDALATLKPKLDGIESAVEKTITGAQDFMSRFGDLLNTLGEQPATSRAQVHAQPPTRTGAGDGDPLTINKGVRFSENVEKSNRKTHLFLATSRGKQGVKNGK